MQAAPERKTPSYTSNHAFPEVVPDTPSQPVAPSPLTEGVNFACFATFQAVLVSEGWGFKPFLPQGPHNCGQTKSFQGGGGLSLTLCTGPNMFPSSFETFSFRGRVGGSNFLWETNGVPPPTPRWGRSTYLLERHDQNARTVVISQTHGLVSQVRLPRWRESLCLLYVQCCHLVSGGSKFASGVSHHTPPPPGGVGLCNQF